MVHGNLCKVWIDMTEVRVYSCVLFPILVKMKCMRLVMRINSLEVYIKITLNLGCYADMITDGEVLHNVLFWF